jgi:hypothetical protein
MANQSPDRREILAMLAKVAALSQFPGFSRWACATDTSTASSRPSNYQPSFFTPSEYELVDQLTEIILPRDDSPGARDAGVAEFIDFMVAHDDSLQYPFRTGLAWLNTFAFEKEGANFPKLPATRQEALLKQLAYRVQFSSSTVQGQEFFALFRRYTVFGYYTSRVGLETLDYPGLRVYSASPECPHHDDPEHKHLPPPRY